MEANPVMLTSTQEKVLAYNFEEDIDLWPLFFHEWVCPTSPDFHKTKQAMFDNSPEWLALVSQIRSTAPKELLFVASNKTILWNVRMRQMLEDRTLSRVLFLYTRAVITLKNKKVKEVGPRAEAKKHQNAVLIFLAQDSYNSMERYFRSMECLVSGKTPSGNPLTSETRTYYERTMQETQLQVLTLVTTLILFKYAKTPEDITNLQNYITYNIIRTLEWNLRNGPKEDYVETRGKLGRFESLRRDLDMSF